MKTPKKFYTTIPNLLTTIRAETRPIDGHTDPNAIQDCWNEVAEHVQFSERNLEILQHLLEILELSDVEEIPDAVERLQHKPLPSSIQEALNSGDGVYRP